MSERKACERADQNPRVVIYQANCIRCDARSLAQSPQAKAREADPDALQASMRLLWPDDADFRKGRPLFWEWVEKLKTKAQA